MDKYTIDTDGFEEDLIPEWLARQQADAKQANEDYRRHETIRYREGQQVGNFIFVRDMKCKNRAVFACPECGKKFQYNLYAIKNKKRCRWYKTHTKEPSS